MTKYTKKYKGFKLVTYKNKDGSFTTYIFNGGLKALNKFTQKLKKHAIGIAESRIDYGDIGCI